MEQRRAALAAKAKQPQGSPPDSPANQKKYIKAMETAKPVTFNLQEKEVRFQDMRGETSKLGEQTKDAEAKTPADNTGATEQYLIPQRSRKTELNEFHVVGGQRFHIQNIK